MTDSPVFDWKDAPAAEFCVVGDPVSHSLSPLMHKAAYAELGLPYSYLAVRVPLSEFAPALERLGQIGFVGCNVTVPLKEAAFSWSSGGDPRQGAVNALKLEAREGTNTDAPGFLKTLSDLGVSACPTLVLGAGGSARALSVALADSGFAVKVHNRTPERAVALVESAGVAAQILQEPDPSGCGLIVNATSAGLVGASPRLLWERAETGALAYDLFYLGDRPTPFVAEAALHGLKAVDGKPLLVAQGALALSWWTGLPPPFETMARAIA